MKSGMARSTNLEELMQKTVTNNRTARTAQTYHVGPTVSATGTFSLSASLNTAAKTPDRKKIEAAVHSHVRALRALGKTQVNTSEIARALRLPVSIVNSVLPELNEKGIKRVG
jgi:hypothetical protein